MPNERCSGACSPQSWLASKLCRAWRAAAPSAENESTRVLKLRLGMAPTEYLRGVRIHRAKHMVTEGVAVASVAVECGFADQAHFTRWFRRTFGYTPGDLAQAVSRQLSQRRVGRRFLSA
jgi:AraC-like DNA-binding protein